MKHFAVYIILVALPVLAVFGVLQIGKTLASPAAVSGSWEIAGTALTSADPTTMLEGEMGTLRLIVSQSGRYLNCSLIGASRVQLSGEIHGEFLTAHSTDINPAVYVNARLKLDGPSHARTLSGTIVYVGPVDRQIEFNATTEKSAKPQIEVLK